MDGPRPRVGWPLEPEPLAEQLKVPPIDVVVAGVQVRTRLELGRRAPDLVAFDPTTTGEVRARPPDLFASPPLLPAVPVFVETDGVDVDLAISRVYKHEARRPFIALGNAPEI